jgi:hypothetical protein
MKKLYLTLFLWCFLLNISLCQNMQKKEQKISSSKYFSPSLRINFSIELTKQKLRDVARIITCYKVADNTKKIIWQKRHSLPKRMGFVVFYFFNFYYSPQDDILYVINISTTGGRNSFCKIIQFKGIAHDRFERVKEISSDLYQKFPNEFDVISNGSFVYFVCKNKAQPFSSIQFNTRIDDIRTCPTVFQLFFPYVPPELMILANAPTKNVRVHDLSAFSDKFPYRLKINNKVFKQQNLFNYWELSYWNSLMAPVDLNQKVLCDSIYDFVFMKLATKQFHLLLNGKVQNNAKRIDSIIYDFIKTNKFQANNLLGDKKTIEAMEGEIKAIPQINFFFAINRLVEQNNRLLKEYPVSEDEITQFYKNYKWAFSKNIMPNTKYYRIEEVKKNIINKIKRIKYYGLNELLTNPPKVEIMWKVDKKQKTVGV